MTNQICPGHAVGSLIRGVSATRESLFSISVATVLFMSLALIASLSVSVSICVANGHQARLQAQPPSPQKKLVSRDSSDHKGTLQKVNSAFTALHLLSESLVFLASLVRPVKLQLVNTKHILILRLHSKTLKIAK